MSVRARLTAVLARIHAPRTTVRGRLALFYGSVFLASGAALLAITYVLVDDAIRRLVKPAIPSKQGLLIGPTSKPGSPPLNRSLYDAQEKLSVSRLEAFEKSLVLTQRTVDLHSLFIGSLIALAVMTAASVLLGWLVARRILRPLRTITNAARHISEESLDQRLALGGPRDELKDLGAVIDGLLERLEVAFEAQRHFVANAAHELRAPLTLERAMLQVTLADPGLTLDGLRAACEDVIDNGRRQEELIDALLTLARSQRGLDHKEALDLAVVAGDMAQARKEKAIAAGLQLDLALRPARVFGDPLLLTRLVANLLDNALHYNRVGGSVRIVTEDDAIGGRLTVANSGPIVPEDQIARLLAPFQRVAPSRTGQHEGHGLGLSIVQAIATAHGARLDVRPGEHGGFNVEIRFPPHPAAAHRVAGPVTRSARLRQDEVHQDGDREETWRRAGSR